MRSPGRSSSPLKSLVLALVVCVVVGELGLTINAAKFLKHEEFQRSMARYRHLLQAEQESEQDASQENLEEQEPEKHVEEFRGGEQQVARHEKNQIDDIATETPEDQQQVDQKVEEQRDEKKSDEILNEKTADQQQFEDKSEEGRDKIKNDEIASEITNDQQQFEERSEEELPEEKKSNQNLNETTADQQQLKEESGEEQLEEEKTNEIPNEIPVEEQNPADEPFVQPEDAYILGPSVTDWDQQRARWLDQNPDLKPTGRPRVLVITGSQPVPCRTALGDSFHIKALKNKIDYARMHKYEIFYNFAFLDPLFNNVWVKLPIIRKLMLTHPEIEWILWMDADAIFTDMLFEPSLESFEDNNLVMWALEVGLFTEKRWLATNDGVFYIRNCQWSLDLLDKWSPMGPVGDVRNEYGKLLSSFFTDRSTHYPADDQSALAYLIITDATVSSKVKFIEENEFKMSSYWPTVVHKFEMYAEKYHPGLGDERWPWVTHFTGCSPCSGGNNPQYSYDTCIDNFNRAFHFGDNQVLAYMGFKHLSLESYDVVNTRKETDRPVIEWMDVNPWAERIAQVAAGESHGQTSES